MSTVPRLPVVERVGLVVAGLLWLATATTLLVAPQVPQDRLQLVATTLAAVCGAVIVLRTDTRLIGWLLLAAGVLWPLIAVFFDQGANPPPSTPWTQLLTTVGELGNSSMMLLLLVYPTGRFDTPLVRAGGWFVLVVGTFDVPVLLLHALGVLDAAPVVPFGLKLTGFAAFLAVGLGVQVRRYRRRPRVEQLQIKWFLFAIGAWLAYPVVFALDLQVGFVADVVITSTVPLAVLVGITRYRLYEIDRLVSRTVAYALVVGVLAAVFVASVTVVTSLLPAQDRLAVAATTIAVVALFDPVRRRVVDAVDRRFDRSRYQARQVVERFGREVADTADVGEVRARLAAVLGTTLAPATVAVWEPRPLVSRQAGR